MGIQPHRDGRPTDLFEAISMMMKMTILWVDDETGLSEEDAIMSGMVFRTVEDKF